MLIWAIGCMFTWGFVSKESPGFWGYTALMFIWPFILGMGLRGYADKWRKNNDKKHTE